MTDITEQQIKQLADGLPPSVIGLDHEEIITWLAKSLSQRDAQVASLTTENLDLKQYVVDELKYQAPATPATDSAAYELMAQGVDRLGDMAGQQYQIAKGNKSEQRKWKSIVFLCCQFAAALRGDE